MWTPHQEEKRETKIIPVFSTAKNSYQYFMMDQVSNHLELETYKVEEATGITRLFQCVRKVAAKMLTPIINWIYNEPDCLEGIYKQFWMAKYRKNIVELIEKYKITTVLISVPAFACLKLGKIIKKKYGNIKLIYDYRDPWHLWNMKKNIAYCKEKRYLKYADKIIGFSDVFVQDMKAVFGIEDSRIHTVTNGFSEEDWREFEKKCQNKNKETRRKLRLTYTGNMILLDRKNNFRNPNKLIEVVQKYEDIEVYLVGVRDVKAGTVDKNIHYIGNVEQKESFDYMVNSDVLISLHDMEDCSARYIVSGKFYDYMRSGRPICHIGSKQSLMSQMIEKFHLGVYCENDINEIEMMFEELLNCWKNGKLDTLRNCNGQMIGLYAREYQNSIYNDVLTHN